jgi:hypothetical protein
MTDDDLYWACITATEYASSFFRALGEAGLKADPINRERLLLAFPEMYATYGPASRLHRRLREGVSA